MSDPSKTKFLSVRLTPQDHRTFFRKSKKYGKPSDLLRELVQAFNEDRLTVLPPVNTKESLYVPRSQD